MRENVHTLTTRYDSSTDKVQTFWASIVFVMFVDETFRAASEIREWNSGFNQLWSTTARHRLYKGPE